MAECCKIAFWILKELSYGSSLLDAFFEMKTMNDRLAEITRIRNELSAFLDDLKKLNCPISRIQHVCYMVEEAKRAINISRYELLLEVGTKRR